MLRVLTAHRLVGEYPAGSQHMPTPGNGLFILNAAGDLVLGYYEADQWHGAGEDLVCAFATADRGCPRCSQPQAGAPGASGRTQDVGGPGGLSVEDPPTAVTGDLSGGDG